MLNKWASGAQRERGEISVELIFILVALFIPVFYFTITLGKIITANLAAQNAAKQTLRAYSLQEDTASAQEQSQATLELILQDYGLAGSVSGAKLEMSCERYNCLQAGSRISNRVEFPVTFPGLGIFGELHLTVSASENLTLEDHR